jgi:excisionase family DNA binding protein
VIPQGGAVIPQATAPGGEHGADSVHGVPPIANRLLTADEVAGRYSVPKAQVYRLTREGKLPTVRIGRYYRYRLAALEAFEDAGGAGSDA